MPDSLRHVSIHCGRHDTTVDLSLPTGMTVGDLLPWIVDALDAGDGTPHRWRLAHVGGRGLDESATLVQNNIEDGDLLILTASRDQPAVELPLMAALTVDSTDDSFPIALRVTVCLWACALGIVSLAWAGLGSVGWGRVAATAAVAVIVTAVTVSAPRLGLSATVITTFNVAAVALAGVLGFLVVPAGPAPANFFLASTAAGSLGVVLIRATGCGRQVLIAVVTVAGVLAATTGFSVLWPVASPALGALVSAVGLGLLPLTPRLSIALAGLTPTVPGYPGAEEAVVGDNRSDADTRALIGHQTLAGLVAGCAAAAALGTSILTLAGLRQVSAVEVAFAAAVGVALLLRSRTYASGPCRTAAVVCGFLSLTATFILVVAWAPAHGSWAGILAVAAGIAVLWPVTVQSPVVARLADVIEYGALAAVVPLACWLAGAFDLFGDLGLR
ncbi:type VII secretion integral membrane protein EccD [Mycolicibacterium boenickei]|uniref:Type VII secretion integral membrane protein EccD n=1 Tax=Mycolicibacterium boenickei TaxID=146017 RepID=A0AAX2ZT31_9MYCO|nr:type VII secretion integral membrane protein EccD [Mycolicibacterium boenickei]UNB98611.1 type VII secretion integral membrane protein EccD [Mycolicibacterium boenickei]BBX94452.1 type VII secretion integral membrane protein EccD [Mycolicibacterium boenickei]